MGMEFANIEQKQELPVIFLNVIHRMQYSRTI